MNKMLYSIIDKVAILNRLMQLFRQTRLIVDTESLLLYQCCSFQEHKVLLTGTPLQNTVEELFSLLHFLEPARFPSENTFMQEFGDLKTEEQVSPRKHKEYILTFYDLWILWIDNAQHVSEKT